MICRFALGILGANGDLGNSGGDALNDTIAIGELSLDGRVRPVRGALSIALRARENGVKNLILPEENGTEAAVVSELNVFPVRDLRQAVEIAQDLLAGKNSRVSPLKLDINELKNKENNYRVNFSEVRGQASAKRALEVASAGGS